MAASYNILMIYDDAFMRNVCYQTLAKHGHRVTLAKNGREGLSLFEKWSFDLILLNLRMPGEDGLFVLAKLLKAVEEKCISKVGDHKVPKVDVRLISATNRNLEKAVANRLFRKDLFFRLNVVSICLPPLRERKEDIPLLVKYFLNRCCKREGKAIEDFSPNAMKALLKYHWPGNIRELENTVERLVVFALNRIITIQDIVYSNIVIGCPSRCRHNCAGIQLALLLYIFIFYTLNFILLKHIRRVSLKNTNPTFAFF